MCHFGPHLISPKPLVNLLVGNLPMFVPKKKHPEIHLVGGCTTPFEKYARQNGKLPPNFGWTKKNIWNLHPVLDRKIPAPQANLPAPSISHADDIASHLHGHARLEQNASNWASEKFRHEKKPMAYGVSFCWVSKNGWFIKLFKRKTSFIFIPNAFVWSLVAVFSTLLDPRCKYVPCGWRKHSQSSGCF